MKRTIKKTQVLQGTELYMFMEPLYYDHRLPVRDDRPNLNYNLRSVEVKTDEEWSQVSLARGLQAPPFLERLSSVLLQVLCSFRKR